MKSDHRVLGVQRHTGQWSAVCLWCCMVYSGDTQRDTEVRAMIDHLPSEVQFVGPSLFIPNDGRK